jgi:hypothetical protein
MSWWLTSRRFGKWGLDVKMHEFYHSFVTVDISLYSFHSNFRGIITLPVPPVFGNSFLLCPLSGHIAYQASNSFGRHFGISVVDPETTWYLDPDPTNNYRSLHLECPEIRQRRNVIRCIPTGNL